MTNTIEELLEAQKTGLIQTSMTVDEANAVLSDAKAKAAAEVRSELPVTFGKPVSLGDGESETEILQGGEVVGRIQKESYSSRTSMSAFTTAGYDVEFFIEIPGNPERYFDAANDGARTALAAAKAWAKKVLTAREVA